MKDLFGLLRRLYSHKLYSVLNICGLGISLSVCLVLALYVNHELGYDDDFANSQRIYRVAQVIGNPTNQRAAPSASSARIAELFPSAFPQVEAVTRHTVVANPVMLTAGDTSLQEAGLRYADDQFFRVFDFPVIAGELSSALDRPDGLVLTRGLAEKLFAGTDVVGRTLTVNGSAELVVTAVIDIPGDTHFNFTAMAPMAMFASQFPDPGIMSNWGTLFSRSYVLLREGAVIDELVAGFPGFLEAQASDMGMPIRFVVTPLTGIHLGQNFQGNNSSFTNLQHVQLFAAIAVCILLIAVVNFMNLATAGASRRAREVGVKMAIGAGKARLVRQFLAESLLMVVLAMLLALCLAEVFVLPVMNSWLQLELRLDDVPTLQAAVVLTVATLGLGLLAGSYPAFYLTAWSATRVLRGELTRGRGGQWFRSALVVLQFTISIALIVATLVMNTQLRFARNIDTGFDASNIMMLSLPRSFDVVTQGEGLIDRLRAVPGVDDVALSMASPLQEFRLGTSANTPQIEQATNLILAMASSNYLEMYRISLLAGRYPDSNSAADSTFVVGTPEDADTSSASAGGGIVLNESAAVQLGWTPEEAIGRTLQLAVQQGQISSSVIGVVQDTFGNVRERPVPLIYLNPRNFNYASLAARANIRLAAGADAGVRTRIEQVWKAQLPADSLQVSFLADVLAAQYAPDLTQTRVFGWSAFLAVLIACFGLFGLATFNTERRTKEIGIRKVMGGSVWQIVLLLTNDFSRLVLLSNLIAWPLAYIAMTRWLENFAYRIDLTPLVFIGSGLIALCIAWVTVGGTAAKAARQKPVLALRYE